MDTKEFGRLVDKITQRQPITAEQVVQLALFAGGNESTEAQRSALVMILGMQYFDHVN